MREDLLREATALVQRVELSLPGRDEPVVVGFRRDGSASFFFGDDPVYQFNTAGELRRAFVGGLLYKAERGQLVALRRERTASETALLRHELSPDETAALISAAERNLGSLRDSLHSGDAQVIRQVPENADVRGRIASWLNDVPKSIPIATAPGVR